MDRSVEDEKLTEIAPEVAPTTEAAIKDDHGQAAVLANLHTLGPGDSDLLAQRLRDFPELHDQILEWAMAHLGNDTVNRALAAAGKDEAKEGAKAATDDGFVQDQIEVMAQEQSDEEFVAFQMGVMAEEKKAEDDNEFVEQQMEEMAKEQSDEEFVAFQMGVMAKEAEDDQFVKDQIQEMDRTQNDEQFVAEQMGVMAQAEDDEFVKGQIEEMAKEQSDEEFVAFQMGVMEAEQKEEQAGTPAQETKDEATDAAEATLVDTVTAVPEAAPELIGTALAEHPDLRAPILEEATKEQGAEVVAEAVVVEEEEKQAETSTEPAPQQEEIKAEPVIEEALTQPHAVEEAWVAGARRYNERHAELVAAFNELTDNQYVLPDGSVSPEVIIAWQQANGVGVDGRIGPETIAAARAGARRVPLADAVSAVQVEDEEPVADPE
ncbi:MAG: hypothetical protein IPL61_32825 [Myxococcales bacterium]|nr:hypothetical protein [Myxococcales bacterium]